MVVCPADTADPSPLVEFTTDDVLNQNCGLSPKGDSGTDANRGSWYEYPENNLV